MYRTPQHDMFNIFARKLAKALNPFIKGTVNCHIINDTLIVDIYSANGIVFRYTRDNMASEIVQGLSSEMLVEKVVKRYRKYINNLYFY